MPGDTNWQVLVQLRGGKEIQSPFMTQEDADQQLRAIRDTLGSGDVADVPWLGAMGADILAVNLSKF